VIPDTDAATQRIMRLEAENERLRHLVAEGRVYVLARASTTRQVLARQAADALLAKMDAALGTNAAGEPIGAKG